ncbi:MAG: hypothetical protein Q7V03_01545 [Cypionkella sp.]|nr:hypothetical protein [Cypionkella sp.]MDO8982314.1 hypothetical protein [Cypionkella sp.]MDP2048505.1 hypothetical protein [Cypionkella sp.]
MSKFTNLTLKLFDPRDLSAGTRLPNITVSRVHELLPWHWKAEVEAIKAA